MSLTNRVRACLVALAVATSLAFAPGSVGSAPSKSSFFQSRLSDQELLRLLKYAEPRTFEPVGHSSVTFRVGLGGSVTAAYKVASRHFPRAPFAEVAAYRVGSLLGLDNIPPAVLRRMSRGQIDAGIRPEYRESWREIEREVLWVGDAMAEGVASLWVVGLRSLRLEDRQRWWRPWLRGDSMIPKGRRQLARDLSNMVVFDYLVRNRDRFSPGHMLVLPSAGRLVLIDQDHAFPIDEEDADRSSFLIESLKLTERFSRRTINRLRALEIEDLQGALRGTPRPLVGPSQIHAVMTRRDVVLSWVAGLIEARGEDAVLYFD